MIETKTGGETFKFLYIIISIVAVDIDINIYTLILTYCVNESVNGHSFIY